MRVPPGGMVPMLAVGVVMAPLWPTVDYLGITPTSGRLCASRDDAPQEDHRQEAREHRESSPVSFARTPNGSRAPQGERDGRGQTRSKNERSNSGSQRVAPCYEVSRVVSGTAELAASSGSPMQAGTNVPASGRAAASFINDSPDPGVRPEGGYCDPLPFQRFVRRARMRSKSWARGARAPHA